MKHATLAFLVVIVGLGVTHPAPAATRYVSPVGRDSSNGASPERAWRTIRRVNRASLRPGDRVLFRGSSGSADHVWLVRRGKGKSCTRHLDG